MLRLNSDILFEIGKKLIEDGDSDAVLRFGLSGKESWNALIKVFASVKILKLYYFYYSIGWDENCCCTFYFGSNPHSTFLMNCIGASVKNLQLFEQFPIYKQILDKISERQQLNSIFIDPSFFSIFFSVKLLKHHSKTLKHVSIPSQCMTEELQNLLNLESLTCLDFCGTKEFLQNFCKTTFLTLQSNMENLCK
uniref:Uncharacterized protein n=1 Tax=Panagrolaimus superbus TaxID=310955 RepID=A0A914YY77_9BILA